MMDAKTTAPQNSCSKIKTENTCQQRNIDYPNRLDDHKQPTGIQDN